MAAHRSAIRGERGGPERSRMGRQGYVDRAIWCRASELGLIGADLPEEYGGLSASFAYAVVVAEELSRVGANALRVAIGIHVIAAH